MKKIMFLLILSVMFSVSCSKLMPRKTSTRIKKVEETKSPVPEFADIEKYIRNSYGTMDMDEIRRETYIAQSPHLDIKMKELILKGKVIVGMYKEDVLASLGKPRNKMQSATDFGLKEEWIYENQSCYFENGILKSIYLMN